MGDLKPLGSEKLTGQEKINRILEIARFRENKPQVVNETSRSEYSIGLADGNSYQIVKEKLGYIIKKNISESETDYIEPMKNRKYFSSYSQALKRLNLLAGELNRLNENSEGVSFFGEQKKFVLKTPKPAQPEPEMDAPPSEPPAVPSPELPPSPQSEPSPEADMPSDLPSEDEMGVDMEVDAEAEPEAEPADLGGEPVSFKQIQKLTGKLTQKMRDLDNDQGMTSEDIKYVINMVLSAADLKNLSEEDKEDILSKFEDDEMGDDMDSELEGDDMGGEDLTDDSEVEKIQADMDVPVESEMGEESISGAILDSIFSESKIDRVISKYFELSDGEKIKKRAKITENNKRFVETKMRSVRKLTETVEQELASQKFLEENNKSKFIGKTNKNNLLFVNEGKKFKISPEGLVL
jgi:hypothetical protein